jgi:hypothetical protein
LSSQSQIPQPPSSTSAFPHEALDNACQGYPTLPGTGTGYAASENPSFDYFDASSNIIPEVAQGTWSNDIDFGNHHFDMSSALPTAFSSVLMTGHGPVERISTTPEFGMNMLSLSTPDSGFYSTRKYDFMVRDPLNIEPPIPLVMVPVNTRVSCTEPGCNVTFSRESDRRRHVRTIHQLNAGYYCKEIGCSRRGEGYSRKDKLIEHQRKKHMKRV